MRSVGKGEEEMGQIATVKIEMEIFEQLHDTDERRDMRQVVWGPGVGSH